MVHVHKQQPQSKTTIQDVEEYSDASSNSEQLSGGEEQAKEWQFQMDTAVQESVDSQNTQCLSDKKW